MSIEPDPFKRFEAWLAEASAAEPDANAMTLCTVGPTGQPSARVVLLKHVDHRGFVFYTNLESRKGREALAHPQVALDLHWKSLRRQVRVEGRVERIADAEADAYFATRPRLSQVGAWASLQSQPLPHREALEMRVAEVEARYPGAVPRPPHWSGLRVVPVELEFWTDRSGRLHERHVYRRADPGAERWDIQMLFP